MKLSKKVNYYNVEKFDANLNTSSCGRLPYVDVVKLLKGYRYDGDYDMYFSKSANYAYSITEA